MTMKPGLVALLCVLLLMPAWGATSPRDASDRGSGRDGTEAAVRKDTTTSAAPVAAGPTIGDAALTLDGDIHLDASSAIFKGGHPFLHTYGDATNSGNTALGTYALSEVTPGAPETSSGKRNTAIGKHALQNTTSGRNDATLGYGALYNNTTGSSNTAVGAWAMYGGRDAYDAPALTGGGNTAVGTYTLYRNTAGHTNTAVGWATLYFNTTGYRNTAIGRAALLYNEDGYRNTAVGNAALLTAVSATHNTAVGNGAAVNTTASHNTAVGNTALHNNTTGTENVALGNGALYSGVDQVDPGDPGTWIPLGTGSKNIAIGAHSMYVNEGGAENVAIGHQVLNTSTSGSRNIVLGKLAGTTLTTGSDNILIGHQGGAAGENNTIRIGTHPATLAAPTVGEQAHTFLAGVYNQTIGVANHQVCIDNNYQLGACGLSSLRFKRNVESMGEASAPLFELRPVTFRFNEGLWGGPEELQFGLIAEEVAEIFPELVGFDEEGRPLRVHYERLSALLLNELQKQQTLIRELQEVTDRMAAQLQAAGVLPPRLAALDIATGSDPPARR